MEYEYVQTDRLRSPHMYQFAPSGSAFIQAYTASRASFRGRAGMPPDVARLHASLASAEVKHSTSRILRDAILAIGSTAHPAARDIDVLLPYVRKFEVTKKLYAEYDAAFKPATEAYDVVLPYFLLSYGCLFAFRHSGRLLFLNAALKLNDLLCSAENRIAADIEREIFAACLHAEHDIVSSLYAERGIPL